MNLPVIDQALMQARGLIGVEGGVAKPARTAAGTWTFVPAREYVRVAREALARVGLALRARDGQITPGGLVRVYRLTSLVYGDVDEWSTVTPLDPDAAPDLAASWARTHSMSQVIRDLLWIGEEDEPDPSERPGRNGRAPREDRTSLPDRNEAGPPAPPGERRTVVCGDRPSWWTRDGAQPSRRVPRDASMEEHLDLAPGDGLPAIAVRSAPAAALEHTLTSRGAPAGEIQPAAPPASGVLPEAASLTASECVAQTTTPHPDAPAEGPTTEGSVPEAGPEADPSTDSPTGTDALTPGDGASAVEESSPAPECVAPGQGPSQSLDPEGEDDDAPEFMCSECGDVYVEVEGEVCGLCMEAVRCVSCEEPLTGEPADEEDGGPLCSKCAGTEGWCGRVGAPRVRCSTCGRTKAPHGRSVSPETPMCDEECPGYREEPRPDQLWPGEKCAPPLCQHAGPLEEPSPLALARTREAALRAQAASVGASEDSGPAPETTTTTTDYRQAKRRLKRPCQSCSGPVLAGQWYADDKAGPTHKVGECVSVGAQEVTT